MSKHLFIITDTPYGTERSYKALRLARSLLNGQQEVRLFLMGDAAACAATGQKVPQGYYNIGDMLAGVIRRKGEAAVCGTCMDARGMSEERLIEGAVRGSMDLLTEWTAAADKVLVF